MNNMAKSRLFTLFELYYKGIATPSETEELMQLLENVPDETLSEILQKTWEGENYQEPFFTSETREKFLSHLRRDEGGDYQPRAKRTPFFIRVAAAAAVLVALSTTAFFLFRKEDAHTGPVVQNPPETPRLKDIAPGGDKAILTLADGRQIVLDTASNGALTKQGSTTVIKIGGQLSYNPEGNSSEVLYNTITTPKGGQYQLELVDGSKVWLNAASSLRFPTVFAGKERAVELKGEGYFEVAHNPAMPFHVKVGEMDVQVLGTHFNINSYSDEPLVKTTLLEGRVKVAIGANYVYLNPKQQAILQPLQQTIRVADDVYVEEVVAWKNGRFMYNGADIETIMRQVARWYDVDIVYEKKIKETFSGALPRSNNVSQLLRMLAATGSVNFEINGKQIIVKP